ncbi:MAG TPA: glycosyltransferase, partial [Novosphingobium sp.]|nr:glycosyltransferase [Novosphingobium sp.]
VVVAGLKRPDLARAIAARLAPALPVDCLTQPLPRPAFLARLGAARIAITLPEVAEGCFLPALEAMAAGCAVICPDAGGNRDFCRDGETCLMPPATPPDLADAACALLADGAWAARLAAAGRAEAARRSLAAERAAFIAVLASVASRLSPAAV